MSCWKGSLGRELRDILDLSCPIISSDGEPGGLLALEFYSTTAKSCPFILAGEGCYLKVFEASTSTLLYQCKVFEDQAIHGIAARQNSLDDEDDWLEVVVWGGSFLSTFCHKKFTALLDFHETDDRLKSPSYRDFIRTENSSGSNSSGYKLGTCVVSDWILHVAISPYNPDECVVITAHNTILRVRTDKISGEIYIETLSSPSRSILYSAQLSWESERSILVAAGTVFGEIIVWQCTTGTIACGSRVLHTFTGHEGSIFGVSISPVVIGRDGNPTKLLASCSDDRTIRIWELDLGGEVDGMLQESIAARETGFGGNGEQGETSSKCLAMAMGHASRIWSVHFLVHNSDISVLSFGEDATTQHWTLADSGYRSSVEGVVATAVEVEEIVIPKLTHLNTCSFNNGKHIWSKAVRQSDGTATVATGGADGKVSLCEISTSSQRIASSCAEPYEKDISNTQSQSWGIDDVLKDLLPNRSLDLSDPEPRLPESTAQEMDSKPASNFAVIPDSSTSLDEQEVPEPALKKLQLDDNLKKKPKSKPKKPPKDAFNKYAFVSDRQVLVTTSFGRVLLAEIGISTSIIWSEVDMPEGRGDLRSYSVVRGISAAGIAFLGSANGSIFLYRNRVIREFGKVSGKIADMFTIYDENECVEILVTTLGVRVATLFKDLIHYINALKDQSLKQTERTRIPSCRTCPAQVSTVEYFLPEKFVVTSAGRINDFLILGSRFGNLAVYDLGERNEPQFTWKPSDGVPGDAITSIVNLSEASSDSSTRYFLTTGRNGLYSIFSMTASNIHLIHQGFPPFGPMIEAAWFSGSDLILYGFKSKNFIVWNEKKQYEISSVECGGAHRSYAYSPTTGSDGAGYFIYTKASKLYLHSQQRPSHQIIKSGGHGREIKAAAVSPDGLVATGAEDTAIRIWQFQDGKLPAEKQFDCLAVVQKHTTGIQHLQWHGSNYLFSSGGNEEFFIWAVEAIPGFGIGVVCEASCLDESEEKDLRIMSFDITSLPQSGEGPERILISLAYSDSTTRSYIYSKTEKFRFLATGRYMSSCLMQLRHLDIRGQELFFLTAGTDGYLTTWRTVIVDRSTQASRSMVIVPLSHRVHQSSIKCLDIIKKDNNFVVVTGGDDNALAVTIYQAALEARPRSIILRSAHAAAITALRVVSAVNGKAMRIVTSSNDQRVKEWGLSLNDSEDMNNLAVTKLGDVFTSVADVGDVTVLTREEEAEKVMVVGNGMEVYKVSRVHS